MANEVTDENFDEVIKKEKNILLKLGAEWCSPCKNQDRIIDGIIEKGGIRKDLAIYSMNVDNNPNTAVRLQVRGIPVMILFQDEEIKGTKVGLIQEKPLLEWIDETIGN